MHYDFIYANIMVSGKQPEQKKNRGKKMVVIEILVNVLGYVAFTATFGSIAFIIGVSAWGEWKEKR